MTHAAQDAGSPLAIAVQVAVAEWRKTVAQFDKSLAQFVDDDLQRVVAPGRNRIYYLLGHLVAVHDRVFALLRLGEREYAALDPEFLEHPDSHAGMSLTGAAELRVAWAEVNARLDAAFDRLKPEAWLERHANISPEDFANQPHRNRLAVLLSRTTHLAMHDGQVRLALPRR